MSITDYASLVASARQQDQPQRLLFTFTRAEAEPGGQGKSLTPVLCADKLPEELKSFDALLEESKQMPAHWDVVFVAGLAGSGGQPPAPQECEAPLRAMVKSIEEGRIDRLLAFDRNGDLLRFGRSD